MSYNCNDKINKLGIALQRDKAEFLTAFPSTNIRSAEEAYMITNKCGIYKITNTVTGDYYIGSSDNIQKRIHRHHDELTQNQHCNRHLQRAWDKYGADNFEFKAILLCPVEKKLYFEQEFLDLFKPAYNIATCATASMQGLHHTAETRAKMLGRIVSEEARAKMSATHKGELHPNFGKHLSDNTCAKISVAIKGELNYNFGKHPTEEARVKMSEALIGNTRTLGYKHTEEARVKISEAGKGNTYALDYKHTAEARIKISEASKKMWAIRREAKVV